MRNTPVVIDNRADEIDLRDLVATLTDGRWLIAKIAAGIFLLSLAYVFFAPPIYRADALLLVEQKTGGLEELTSLLTGEIAAEAEMQILRSRSVVGATVEQLALDIVVEPKYFPFIGGFIARRHSEPETLADAWFGMTSYAWGGEHILVSRLDIPAEYEEEPLKLVAGENNGYLLYGPDDEVLVKGVVNKIATISVPRNPLSGSAKAGTWAIAVPELRARPGTEFTLTRLRRNTVMTDLQEDLKIAERGQKTGVLELTLEGKEPETVAAIVGSIATVYLRHNTERRSKQAEQTLEFLDKQLPVVKGNLDASEAVLNRHRMKYGSVNLTLEIQGLLVRVAEVEKELSVLRLQRADLLQRFTEHHPTVVALTQKMTELERMLSTFNNQIKRLPETEQEVLGIMRDVKVNTDVYTLLLNKTQELKVAKAGTIGNAYIVDYPIVPHEPVKPNKPLVLLLGAGLGLFAGGIAAVMRKSLIGGVEDAEIVERQLNIPIYAIIPHSDNQAKLIGDRSSSNGPLNPILAISHPKDVAMEGLRSLRTSLQFALTDARNPIIAIGGPRPDIGKSFVSANLAHVLAEAGKTVLLIDGDMRRGYLNDYFGIPNSPGLSELLSGTAKITQTVRKTEVDNLHLLTTGVLPPNPSELLMTERFRELLDKASQQYDLVLIDTPPVLSVTDGAIISKHAGTNFLVLRSGLHPLKEIERAIKHIEQSGAKLQGIIFNDVPVRRGLYGYHKYGYYLGYEQESNT